MYCPQCGQEQASSEMRFCSRCGFPLGRVARLLESGGVAAMQSQPGKKTGPQVPGLSPRQKGTRAGIMQMMSGLLVVPIVAILSHNIFGWQGLIIPLAALITFVGGLLRIIYARLYEDDTPEMETDEPPAPAHLSTRARVSALPPQRSVPASDFAPRRVNTAELVPPPPSVTENTTRLLDEDKITRGE